MKSVLLLHQVRCFLHSILLLSKHVIFFKSPSRYETKPCSCFASVSHEVWITGTVGKGALVSYYGPRSLELITINPIYKEALLQSVFEGLEWFLVPSLLVKPSLEGPAKYWSSF